MNFRGCDRAQSIQLGAVLLFAFLILAAAGYQAVAVPDQNARVEFDHNERVHDQIQELRTGIHTTGSSGSPTPATVLLSPRYPQRTVFLNPPATAGTLETGEPETVEIDGVEAIDAETRDFWDGETTGYETRALRYRPEYNEYRAAPTTIYESTILYNDFGDAHVLESGQRIVNGRDISLVTLQGEFRRSESGAVGVEPRPVSAPTRTVAVEGDDIEITVPSGLSQEHAEALFAEEHNVEEVDATGETLTIRLDDEVTYRLRLADVGVGSDLPDRPAAYVTDRDGDRATIPESGTQRLVVEVRDRYNAPVDGEDVDAEITDGCGGALRSDAQTTAEDGRATFVYEAPDDVGTTCEAEITVEIDDGGGPEEVVFAVFVLDVGN